MRTRALGMCAALAVCAACSPPKYAEYTSVSGDFAARVPWGWRVIADADHDAFAQASFLGPFDPDFYLGVPSLSVRWYKRYRPHRLRDGRLEMYADAGDFIAQTLSQVYGPQAILYGAGRREDGGREIVRKPEKIVLQGSGLPAFFFGVLSPTPAPAGNRWGVGRDDRGRTVNVRLHDYVVVPVAGGFYVLCYPATLRGYDKDAGMFRALVNTFRPLTAGPGGPKLRPAARAAAR